jgi:tetratricopeptide (TPR) repeat protein
MYLPCELDIINYTNEFSKDDTVLTKKIQEIKSFIQKGQFYAGLSDVTFLENCLVYSDLKTHDRDPFLHFMDKIEDFLESNDGKPEERQLLVLLVGVCYFKIFIQNNWTGPTAKVPKLFSTYDADLTDLSVEEELVFAFVNDIQYFKAAKTILVDLQNELGSLPTACIWSARCNFVHQQILLGPSEKLRRTAESGFEKAIYYFTNKQQIENDFVASLHIELGLVYNFYKNVLASKNSFQNALSATGLELNLTGAMGRRTKYQTFDTPQLVLQAKSKFDTTESKDETKTENGFSMPANVENINEEAVALDSIKFVNDISGVKENLKIIDQAILLAMCLNVKNGNPKCGLVTEEMEVYIRRVLENPNNWMVYSMALLIRSRLESDKLKTADRACMQLSSLVEQMNSDLEKNYDVTVRMKYIHIIGYPPMFKLERELGRKWLAIGSFNSALEIFEKYEMWEDIITVYQIKGETKIAEDLVRKRIEIKPTAELYCILGDITTDISHYTFAWEFSKHRFARAKRSLGLIAMQKFEYAEAIKHYSEALAINPQYPSSWFRLGCCALKVNDLTVAQKAFARVVQMHSDDAEAWNNLAAVYVSQNKKKEAFQALKHALQIKNDNWKIWENYIKIAIEIREIAECLRGLTELLKIKETNKVDVAVLSTVIKFVLEDIDNGASDFESIMFQQLNNFLSNVSMKVSDDPEVWDLYSKYYLALGNIENSIMYRQMQCRALQKNGWEHTESLFKPLTDACEHYTKVHLLTKEVNRIHAARLYLNSLIKKSEDSFGGTEPHNKLKEMLSSIIEREEILKKEKV